MAIWTPTGPCPAYDANGFCVTDPLRPTGPMVPYFQPNTPAGGSLSGSGIPGTDAGQNSNFTNNSIFGSLNSSLTQGVQDATAALTARLAVLAPMVPGSGTLLPAAGTIASDAYNYASAIDNFNPFGDIASAINNVAGKVGGAATQIGNVATSIGNAFNFIDQVFAFFTDGQRVLAVAGGLILIIIGLHMLGARAPIINFIGEGGRAAGGAVDGAAETVGTALVAA